MTDHFLPGQRWVSHADSTLGLGIVTHADERRVTLHFPAVEEERVYATDRAPLTRLLLKPGDQLTRMDGSVLTVIALQEEAGVITYDSEGSSGEHASRDPGRGLRRHNFLSIFCAFLGLAGALADVRDALDRRQPLCRAGATTLHPLTRPIIC